MRSEWIKKPITEIVEFNPKYSVKKGTVLPYVEMAAVPEHNREISYFEAREFKGGGSKFKNGDTLFSRITPCLQNGKTSRVSGLDDDQIANGSTEFIVMSAKEDEDKDFVYYLALDTEFRKYSEGRMEGTTGRQRVSWQALAEYEIPMPPKETRKKIAHILSTLDDKIELNRKMNQTLEEMAQVLFKSWFVDFDPVRAKAEARSEAELEAKAAELGISKEVLDLFPSRLVESEMGMIPEGWEIKPFGELLSKTIGGDWGKEEPDDKHTEKVKIIRGTDIPKIKNISIEAVPTRYVEVKKLKTRELFDGDIVIEVSGGTKNQPTGRSLYITNEILEMLGNKVEPASFCRLFRPINAEIGLILGQHMLHIYDQGKTWQYQNQSTGISNFQTTIFLEKEHVLVPDAKVLTEFYKIVRPLIEKSLSSENITLQKTRDTLLPKLLSGELDVSEVEID